MKTDAMKLAAISALELREFAADQAKTIVIRSYDNGNSRDDRRKATKRESKIIESVIYGGLLAIKSGRDHDGVINACEYIADIQLPTMNGYDTIYCPLKDWISRNL